MTITRSHDDLIVETKLGVNNSHKTCKLSRKVCGRTGEIARKHKEFENGIWLRTLI